MGGANVGPEFTAEEYLALKALAGKEAALAQRRSVQPSGFLGALEEAVVASSRWQKWLLPAERGRAFSELSAARRDWLLQTGARYIWTQPPVVEARARLYANLGPVMGDPNVYVVDRIARAMDRYVNAFHLFDSLTLFSQ
jgi:tagatose-1,6-bisphosphate aldolase non-catalytic subunit AgaZ/GatZ